MRHENTRTSERVKTSARKILRDPTSPPMAKSLAACCLTRAPNYEKAGARIVAKRAKEIMNEHNIR